MLASKTQPAVRHYTWSAYSWSTSPDSRSSRVSSR